MSTNAVQDIKAVSAFKQRAMSLHLKAATGAEALIELGAEINKFIDAKLYLSECDSVESFFQKNFNWSDSYVRRLRRAANIAGLQGFLPPEAMKKARGKRKSRPSGTQGSAPNTQPQSNNNNSSKRKEVDRMGFDIPEPRFPIWDRRGEIDSMIQAISEAKCKVDAMRKAQDPMYLKIKQEAVEALERAHYLVSKAMVYCVCGICGGWLETRGGVCAACKSTGFMTLEEYKLTVPEETRRVRENSIAARKAAQ